MKKMKLAKHKLFMVASRFLFSRCFGQSTSSFSTKELFLRTW